MPAVRLVIAIAITAAMLTWRAFVLSVLWAWFMVPLFGLPALGVAASLGVVCVASAVKQGQIHKDNGYSGVENFVMAFALPLISLGIGWVAHAAM